MTELKNAVFVVTGAASGIGRATAIRAAVAGARVLASDSNPEALRETAAAIAAAGGLVESAPLDVSRPEQVQAYARRVGEQYGGQRLILLNNAGVALGTGTFAQTSLDDFAWLLGINLWGVVYMSKALLPLLRRAGARLPDAAAARALRRPGAAASAPGLRGRVA